MSDVRDDCGLDLDGVTPPDAMAAVRSYPRRYRAELSGWPDDEDPDDVVRRPPAGGGWSALQHVVRARDAVRQVALAIHRAELEDAPAVEAPALAEGATGGPAPSEDEPLSAVLDDLTAASDDLARTLGGVGPEAWDRVAVVGGQPRTVLWLAREAVHQGAHHLRDVERVLRQVRGD